jgi:hypothetical protein
VLESLLTLKKPAVSGRLANLTQGLFWLFAIFQAASLPFPIPCAS